MVVDGTEYGEVRQYGNFSFARIYESGHEIPYYQRKSTHRSALNWAYHCSCTNEMDSRRCTGIF
jgi:carboxypeptidase C (cathepsin A)